MNIMMKLFGKGKINTAEILNNCSLGEMVFCQFDFCPWCQKVTAQYITVNIKRVEVDKDGVYARTDNDKYGGAYVGKITSSCGCSGWGGIFNTKEEAEKCFRETMTLWKSNID